MLQEGGLRNLEGHAAIGAGAALSDPGEETALVVKVPARQLQHLQSASHAHVPCQGPRPTSFWDHVEV
eukprot:1210624-Rhodomonas_salina.1